MNEQEIKVNWKQVKGEVQGPVDILAGKIQKRYGKAKEDAFKEVNEFLDSIIKNS